MAMDIALARLVGFCADIALSMVYTAFFGVSMYVWALRRKDTGISTVIPCVLVVMYVLNVAQLCLQAADIYRAFFIFREADGGPAAYFFAFNSRVLPSRDAIFWTMSMLTDALMIWRLFVIWKKSFYVIALPVALLIAGCATGVVMYFYTVARMYENDMRLSGEIDKWWMVTLALTIALNILTPGLIIGRLWYIARQVGVLGSRSSWRYKRVALVLMEAGGMYTLFLTAWLIIFATGSLAALWMTACILPTLTCIVPTCLILAINSSTGENPVSYLSGRPTQVDTNIHISVSQYRSQVRADTPSTEDIKNADPLPWSTQSEAFQQQWRVSDGDLEAKATSESINGSVCIPSFPHPPSTSGHSIELSSRYV